MDLSNQADVRKIVEGCADRNAEYQQFLYKTLYSKMMVVCQRYANRPEDAKDLFQDGFIKVFDKIGKFNFKGSLEGWIRRIMVNNAIDYYRKNKNKFAMSETLVETQQIAEEVEGEGLFDGVSADVLLSFVQQLSPVYRTVFNLYILDDYSHAEIAEELGISEGTSKSNLSKAKKNLKQMVHAHLKECEKI